MKPKIAMRLLGPLIFAVAFTVPAVAQEPSKVFTGFLCEIDLTGIKNKPAGIPARVFTDESTKHCPGNTQSGVSEAVTIDCVATIPGWPKGKSSSNKNLPCRINAKQCGVPNFVNATKTTLNINTSGIARLTCTR